MSMFKKHTKVYKYSVVYNMASKFFEKSQTYKNRKHIKIAKKNAKKEKSLYLENGASNRKNNDFSGFMGGITRWYQSNCISIFQKIAKIKKTLK